MKKKFELNLRKTYPRSGKTCYCLDIEELNIEIGIKLLFRILMEENGHLLGEGCSWLSLKKSQ